MMPASVGGDHAAHDAADDDDGHGQRGQRIAQCGEHRAQRGAFGKRQVAAVSHPTGGGEQVHAHQQPRDGASQKQLAHRHVAHQRVHNERDGGRDDRTHGRCGCHHGSRIGAGIAFLLHGRNHRGADGRGIGHGRAGNAREHHARKDGHVRESAFDVSHGGGREVQQAPRDAAGVHEFTREKEEWDRQEGERVHALDHRGGHDVHGHSTAAEEDEHQRRQPHREEDRHAHQSETHERHHEHAEKHHLLHQASSMPRS